jgi:hypothetical protein
MFKTGLEKKSLFVQNINGQVHIFIVPNYIASDASD